MVEINEELSGLWLKFCYEYENETASNYIKQVSNLKQMYDIIKFSSFSYLTSRS